MSPKSPQVRVQDPCTPSQPVISIDELQEENQQLKQQVDSLANLPEGIQISDLYQVAQVKLTRYTGLYDKDKDEQVDHLCVYIKPEDADGDVVKAAGDVTVQLWNLSGQEPGALLGEWEISSKQLRKEWFSSLMTVNYRLLFPMKEAWLEPDLALTVRIAFKDFLSGQVFTDQMPVESLLD